MYHSDGVFEYEKDSRSLGAALLSQAEKDRRVKICTQLLRQYHNEDENMLKRVVAIDET